MQTLWPIKLSEIDYKILFIYLIAGSIFGVFGFYSSLFFIIYIIFLLFLVCFSNKRNLLIYILVFFVATGLFFVKTYIDNKNYEKNIHSIPSLLDNKTSYVVDYQKRKNTTHIVVYESGVNVLLITKNDIDISYKDEITYTCKPKIPEKFTTIYGREFDYKNYLKTKSILFICYNPTIKNVTRIQDLPLTDKYKRKLLKIRDYFYERISDIYTNKNSSLLLGILLGAKGMMDKYDLIAFQNSGLVHIIVLSGYNIMLVSIFSFYIFRIFFPFLVHIITTFIIVSFGFLVGFDPPALRAVLMVSIFMSFLFFGYKYFANYALTISFVSILFFNTFFIFDVGFLMSFLATFGLVNLYDFFEEKIQKIPNFIKESIISSFIAFVSLLPVLVYFIGSLPMCSIFSNIFVGPVVGIVMFFGFLSVFIENLSVFVSHFLDFIYKIAYIFSGNKCVFLLKNSTYLYVFFVVYYIVFAIFVYIVSKIPKKPDK